MAESTLTLKEAAEALSVHYMTAYRYVRLGILPARKEGSSWAVEAADVERLRSGGTTPQPGGGADWSKRLESRLTVGDEPGAWGVVEAAMAAGASPAHVYTEILAPALRRIGEGWQAGDLEIADEHRASAVSARLVGRLGPRFARRGRSRGTVVAATPPLELHGLPLAIVTDLLRGARFDIIDLGCNVPAVSLAKTVREANRLVAVVISVTTPGTDDAVAEAVAAVRSETAVPVFLGGYAIESERHAAQLGGDGWAENAEGAVALVESAVASEVA